MSSTTEVGPRLDTIRRVQGVAVLPLSKTTGVPRDALSKFFKGERDLPFSRVMTIPHELKAPAASWMDLPAGTPAEVAA